MGTVRKEPLPSPKAEERLLLGASFSVGLRLNKSSAGKEVGKGVNLRQEREVFVGL